MRAIRGGIDLKFPPALPIANHNARECRALQALRDFATAPEPGEPLTGGAFHGLGRA